MLDLTRVEGFDWDDGNAKKSEAKHSVSGAEAEQMFVNRPLLIWEDAGHSLHERRFQALGESFVGRRLFAAFTLRRGGSLIRIISVRDMNVRERRRYEEEARKA